MKKILCLLLLSGFAFMFADVKLKAIEDENVSVTQNGYSSTSTYVSKDNVRISVMATDANEENIKLAVQIKNDGTEDFQFNENSISAYQGVYEDGKWTGITYYPATRYYSEKEYEEAAAVTVAAVGCGLMMMDLLLAPVCDDGPHYHDVKPPRRPSNPYPRRPAPAPAPRRNPRRGDPRPYGYKQSYSVPGSVLTPKIDKLSAHTSVSVTFEYNPLLNMLVYGANDLIYLKNSLLFSTVVKPGETVNGIIFINKNMGPDYKIEIDLGNEAACFYFSRSDKKAILKPWSDDERGHSSFMFSMGLPVPDRYGFYYIYSGVPVGLYLGANYQYPFGVKTDYDGELEFGNYYPRRPVSNYKYSFEANGNIRREMVGFYGGLTVKTFPHTWLMLGCGCDIGVLYRQGVETRTNSSDPENVITRKSEVWALDNNVEVYCTPQVGLNFIFNVLDIGTTFEYRIGDGPQFDIMFGLAF